MSKNFIFGLTIACVLALTSQSSDASIRNQLKPTAKPPPSSVERNNPAPPAVTAPVHGQAGYVHYFVITHPDGTLEDHVGIEMEDQRIAWSFPGTGVSVVDFTKQGTIEADGKFYKIEYLHGIRPFRNERDMQALRNDLTRRVAIWVDDETPYCTIHQPGERFCLSCGDFVIRILFPSHNYLSANLPRDFARTLGQTPTTDDLLLYMLGLHQMPDAKSRLDRLATMRLPDSLRRDVRDLLQAQLAAEGAEKTTVRNRGPRIATRKTQRKRL
jgi:hypothetical protein